MLRKWEDLPAQMQIDEVRVYYDILEKKKVSLFFKRIFDIVASSILLICLSWLFLIIAVAIKVDSRGPVFYRQERVSQYGRAFRIFKFRTMIQDADKGSKVTVDNDKRVTRVGHFIRDFRLDEISQLIDVFRGTMTFVGTRPESKKFVEAYTPEMLATLLLPAGVTSETSILYKDEKYLLNEAEDPERVYIEKIMPEKMKYNLSYLKDFTFWGDIKIMCRTVLAVLKRK